MESVTEPLRLGEGPHWDHNEQALYFVSIIDKTINKYVPQTEKHTTYKLDNAAHFIIPIEGKRNHFVIGADNKVLEIEWDGENSIKILRTVAEVDTEKRETLFNDAKADPRGRLFVGTMGHPNEEFRIPPKKGAIYRIDPDGSVHKLESDIDLSNGLCWDLKEKAFYFVDSFEYVVRRYDYDVETGNISNPRHVFVLKDHELEGFADGMTIDTDGNLWIANFNGGQLLNVDPRTGKLIQKLLIPAKEVTSVTFGGPGFDVLYVTTAAINPEEQKPPCGSTFKVSGLGVKGNPNVSVRLN